MASGGATTDVEAPESGAASAAEAPSKLTVTALAGVMPLWNGSWTAVSAPESARSTTVAAPDTVMSVQVPPGVEEWRVVAPSAVTSATAG
ncbi:hypothetical protein D4739_03520 [Nocardioides cavernaquae]|uniref:Uncharacterized protein n=1 Tax=Nocardioides cavernaquae TaxID=2321396 RepID=A0A3A5HBM3_9ACTN|nr:hypothetical protein D4739_03520 [Nocardioides cavernaquae]